MYSSQNHPSNVMSEQQITDIKAEIEKTALSHLNSENANSALRYYTKDATVISNGILYSSFDSFAVDIKDFYSSLSKINLASYDEMDIHVITKHVALVTAKFRWSSTDNIGITTDLEGVYSALYVFEDGRWKMSWRHESYYTLNK